MQGGIRLEYLSKLVLDERGFRYGRVEVPYAEVAHIRFSSSVKQHHKKGEFVGASHRARLEVETTTGVRVRIRQKLNWFGYAPQAYAGAVAQAAALLSHRTFPYRMAVYDSELRKKGFLSWGRYQIGRTGDVYKDYELLFNLRDKGVMLQRKTPYMVTLIRYPIKLWRWLLGREEAIDIATDRDCFLYYLKHTVGFSWPDEQVYEMPKAAGDEPGSKQGSESRQKPRPKLVPPPPLYDKEFEVLGLKQGAAWADIRAKYKKLAMLNHPDRLQAQGLSKAKVLQAEETFKAINVAYAKLEAAFAPRKG